MEDERSGDAVPARPASPASAAAAAWPGMRERVERAGGSMRAGPTEERLARGAGGAGVIRVLIADDQRVVRDGLAMLVGLIEGVEVVGTAADGDRGARRSRGASGRTSC